MNDTIKSFLVGLGFGIDEAGLAKFNKAISSASTRVMALYGSVKVMAAGIFWSISKISEGFEQMGYEFRIIAPAINKTLVLRRELLKAYSAAGVDIVQAIQGSIKFNMALTKLQYTFKAIISSVAAKFFPLLTKQMDIFRKQIYANMPKIQASLEKFVKFVFKAFEATVLLGTRVWSILQRVYDFFRKLHEATSGWSTFIMGAIAAWRLLNLAFLATPLGMILAGLTALVALYDDFMVWKEGGQSLINWGSDATKTIVGVVAVVTSLATAIYSITKAITIFNVVVGVLVPLLGKLRVAMAAFSLVAALNPIGLLVVAAGALVALLTLLIVKWDAVKAGLASFFGSIGDKIMNFVGGSPSPSAAAPSMGSGLGVNNVAGSSTNQNVKQQTNITVMGTADASATANAVASQQSKVNFDMVRNMSGATR